MFVFCMSSYQERAEEVKSWKVFFCLLGSRKICRNNMSVRRYSGGCKLVLHCIDQIDHTSGMSEYFVLLIKGICN